MTLLQRVLCWAGLTAIGAGVCLAMGYVLAAMGTDADWED